MEETDYPLVFVIIVIAAWHGIGRTVSVSEIETAIKESDFTVKWEAFQKGEDAGINNMLTAFYFHQLVTPGEKRFEFTHKSFREYLTMQRIVRALEDMQDKFDEQERKPNKKLRPLENALISWRKLCAPTAIDSDLYQFLQDEMELLFSDAPESVVKLQEMLCRLIAYVASEGIPPVETRPPFMEELRLYRNAETALLAAHSACARATQKCSKVDWGENQKTANIWLKRLCVPPEEAFVKQCLNHIQWQNQSLDGYSLRGANLAGAKIYGHTIYPEPIGKYGGKDLWWLVLEEDKENHRVLLLALDCITSREYHGKLVRITWKESDLRRWLNVVFLEEAFRDDSRRILPVTVHTSNNPRYDTDGGEDAIEDKLFLLSLEDVRKYFGATEYYKPVGSLVARLNGEAVWWWLRSPGLSSDDAAYVGSDGSVFVLGIDVSWSESAVRPAFWLNRQS
jgi:hypothetical protein